MSRMTKKGALAVTADLDKLANHFQNHWAAMGVPQKIASDFAYRCDLLSDQVDKFAGIDRAALTGDPPIKPDHPQVKPTFDAEAIGEEKSGPEEKDGDESFMDQHFSQQENRELAEAQEGSELGPDKTKDDRQVPQAGIQASAVLADRAAKVTRAAVFALKAEDADVKTLARPLTRLARALSALQADALAGKAINGTAQRAVKAADHLLPTLAKVSTASVPKITEMAKLATRVASGEGREINLLG